MYWCNCLMRTWLPALVLATYLAGCGYKGPLHMPKPTAEKPKRGAVVPPQSAPERPVPAEAAPAPP